MNRYKSKKSTNTWSPPYIETIQNKSYLKYRCSLDIQKKNLKPLVLSQIDLLNYITKEFNKARINSTKHQKFHLQQSSISASIRFRQFLTVENWFKGSFLNVKFWIGNNAGNQFCIGAIVRLIVTIPRKLLRTSGFSKLFNSIQMTDWVIF
jgi:hypothetical protein